ncbi:MAG: PrsW family glutamic-type intramembrane protease [Treponema sp.]|nr:PrsW family glutamic-type intramembrane protease [Treponema sp.]
MSEIWILALLLLTAALPVGIALCWFRIRKLPVTLPYFLAALAAGLVSLLAAALFQSLFPPFSGRGGAGQVFFNVFFRIALIEEASRLIVLVPLFRALGRRRNMDASFCAALGLVAGLGFAMLESAFYGITDANIALLRAFTAAPLHGACGIRVGAAAFFFARNPAKAVFLFVFAVLIHGAYNMMIVSGGLPSALAVLVAFTALFSSLPLLKAAREGQGQRL